MKPTIETFKIETSMGSINTFFGHPLSFLTDSEKKELNTIGYTGKNSKGIPSSKSEFLNSLNKGTFEVTQTKFDNGDFSEQFMIIRVTL